MDNELSHVALGVFNFDLPDRWDAHFFPNLDSKLRLVKDGSIVFVEYFLTPQTESQEVLDSFYVAHIVELQRSINGAIFDDIEDTDYEILAEDNGEFCRYFFLAKGRYIFRFTLSGFWQPQDEDEIRGMLKGLTLSGEPSGTTDEITQMSFIFDYQNWVQIGGMYAKRAV